MRLTAKAILLLVLILTTNFLSIRPALALATFSTDYTITYKVNDQGNTHVIFDVNQKNNLSTVYATSFSLSLSQTNIKNIQIKDPAGVISPIVDRTENLTNINFDFLAKVVGRDQINHFTIQYDTADVASRLGAIWEINIPRLESNENTNSQQIILEVPTTFSQPAFIDPKPARIENNRYIFTTSVLANKSISAVFGATQYFKLDLTYNLNNPLAKQLKTQITFPPDTAYQTVFLKKITPQPTDVAIDPDGNWLASYILEPNSNLQIKLQAAVKLNFNPSPSLLLEPEKYIRALKLWDYTDPDLAAIATNLTTPKAIYDYVVSHLKYGYSRINKSQANDFNRPGAIWALANPNDAICTEFTDLFIAIARKNGIPARENQGYAMSTNDKLKPLSLSKDVLHAWPEYYDKNRQSWIQIDPTWASTTGGIDYFSKLDLNHIVFAIHGLSATQPLPAGAFKTSGGGSKDIFVEVTSPEEFPTAKFDITYRNQNRERLFLDLTNSIGVAGTANISISGKNSIESINENHLLPPFGEKSVELRFKPGLLFYPQSEQLIIDINGERKILNITRQSHLYSPYLGVGTAVIVLGITIFTRRLYIRRFKKQPPIHW